MPKAEKMYDIVLKNGANPDNIEKRCAKTISLYFRSNIEFIPSGNHSSPDMFVRRTHQFWEIKSPKGNSKNTIHHILSEIEYQSSNIVITLYRTKMSPRVVIGRIKTELKKPNGIKKILLITKSEKIIKIK